MLVIRLQRTGRENLPTYRIVVAEKARPVKGKFHEIVGHYLPAREPVTFEFNKEKIEQWIGKGAIPSDTVARLLKRAGMENMDKYIERYTKQKRKKGGDEPPPEAAPAAPAAEAPVEKKEEPAPVEAPATEGDTAPAQA